MTKWRKHKELAQLIDRAIAAATREIAGGDGIYARGLSAEGYAGGYRQALYDIKMILIADVPLPMTRGYWEESQ